MAGECSGKLSGMRGSQGRVRIQYRKGSSLLQSCWTIGCMVLNSHFLTGVGGPMKEASRRGQAAVANTRLTAPSAMVMIVGAFIAIWSAREDGNLRESAPLLGLGIRSQAVH